MCCCRKKKKRYVGGPGIEPESDRSYRRDRNRTESEQVGSLHHILYMCNGRPAGKGIEQTERSTETPTKHLLFFRIDRERRRRHRAVLMATRGDVSAESREGRKRATEEVAAVHEDDLEEEGVKPVVALEGSKHGDGSLYEPKVDMFHWLYRLQITSESK